jgi:hypothetical protein
LGIVLPWLLCSAFTVVFAFFVIPNDDSNWWQCPDAQKSPLTVWGSCHGIVWRFGLALFGI